MKKADYLFMLGVFAIERDLLKSHPSKVTALAEQEASKNQVSLEDFLEVNFIHADLNSMGALGARCWLMQQKYRELYWNNVM